MSRRTDRQDWLRYATAGVEFAVTFGLILGGGLLLDSRWGTLPGFTLWGFAVGFAVALYRLLRQVHAIRASDKDGDDGEDRHK